jgi:hypothetical protein
MFSSHLEAEKQRFLDCIEAIRKSGAVAPARYFLTTTTTASEAGKTYYYARLVREESVGKQTVRPLGRLGSVEHRAWERSIVRRDAIVELEQQLKLLDELMQRQQERSQLVDRDFSEPKEKD